MKSPKLILFFIALMDVIGLSIIIPVMPAYAHNYGMSDFSIGLLFSVYALFSFLCSPLLGALSDRYGRRPILILSLLGTAAGWAISASAYFFPQYFMLLLFFGRMVDGITAGNISAVQSAITDISKSDQERTINLGLMGMAFGLGFVVGPLLGGLLGSVWIVLPFFFALGVAVLNSLWVYKFLPETSKRHSKPSFPLNPLSPLTAIMQTPSMRNLFLIWFLFNLAFSNIQSIFALYTLKQFGFSEFQNGLVLTWVGLIVIFNQGFMLKKVWLKYFDELQLQKIFSVLMLLAFAMIGFPSLLLLFFAVTLISFSQSILRVVLSSQVAGLAAEDQKGELLGSLQSIAVLASVIAPLLGAFVLKYDLSWPWWICVFYLLIAAWFVFRRIPSIIKA